MMFNIVHPSSSMRSALAAQAIIIQEAADTPAATKADAVIINEP
jgi:hypothetical protein